MKTGNLIFSEADMLNTLTRPEKKLLSVVDTLTDDIHAFTARLVAQPSILGQEAGVMQVMAEELARLGYAPRKIPLDAPELQQHELFAPVPWELEHRHCLAAERPADGTGGRSVVFNGHLDVVSPEPLALWERPPFEPLVEDGWMYGRGAGDMKSGVAAMTYALYAVDRAEMGLRAPVILNAVIEEECSGNGALASVLAGCRADAVLIPEPFGRTIYAAQVGVLWFRVSFSGKPVHVLKARSGANAIEKMFPIIQALRGLEAELNQEPRPACYQKLEHPINLNIGIIEGGDWPSTVPAAAAFHGRLSYFPGVTWHTMRQRIEHTITRAAANDPWLAQQPPAVEFYGFRSDGHLVPVDDPAIQTLRGCHRELAGFTAPEYISTATTDLRAFHFAAAMPGTCYGPRARNIHGANEAVELASVQHTARIYALFLSRWCGLQE